MATNEWKVPRPSGVISSRDLARNTSSLLSELMESEHSLMIVRNGLPTERPLSDGDEWVPDAIATSAGVDEVMVLLGFLEISLLIIRRFGYYRISKKGMEVLQALRVLDAREQDGGGG